MGKEDNCTKKKISKVAISLIKENGYDNVTINDICLNSDISKHTFYYYFKSKDDILDFYRRVPGGIKPEKLMNLIGAENNFEKYWLLIENLINFYSEAGVEILKRILMLDIMQDSGTFKKNKNDHIMKLEASFIEQAQKDGVIRNKSNARDLVHINFSQIYGTLSFWARSQGAYDLKNELRYKTEVVFDILPELRKGVRRDRFVNEQDNDQFESGGDNDFVPPDDYQE